MMKIYILILLSLFMPMTAYAQANPIVGSGRTSEPVIDKIQTKPISQSIMVEPSGVYTGPLQKVASPVVVELFSSENCPACPPADIYLGTLAGGSNNIIALSCHVDYFGRTKAGLGQDFCTKRQSKYIAQIGRKSHFTPQMMINGTMSEIGYETSNVAASITKGRAERVASISITPKSRSVFEYQIPSTGVSGTANVWMAVYQKPFTLMERGKKVTYSNVVKKISPLGIWQGGEKRAIATPILEPKSAGFAIIAQDPNSGKIWAAGDYKL